MVKRVKNKVDPTRERSSTVSEIVDAAKRLLSNSGLEQTTFTHVAELVGVSVGTIYQHFPCKEALLDAVLEERFSSAVALLEEAIESSEGLSLEERVRSLVRAMIEIKRADVAQSRVLDHPTIKGLAKRHDISSRACELVEDLLEDHSDELKEVPITVAAFAVVFGLEGALLRALESPDLLSDSNFVETLVRMTLGVLGRYSSDD